MDLDLATETGEYGSVEAGEFFRVKATCGDTEIIFHSAEDGTYDFFARRMADMSNNEFLESVWRDPEVYPNSEVTLSPEFPIGDGTYQNLPLAIYKARNRSERESDAIVDVSLDENVSEEKVRWVNLEKDPDFQDSSYCAEIWYIGSEPDSSITRYFSEPPLSEEDVEEIATDMTTILNRLEE